MQGPTSYFSTPPGLVSANVTNTEVMSTPGTTSVSNSACTITPLTATSIEGDPTPAKRPRVPAKRSLNMSQTLGNMDELLTIPSDANEGSQTHQVTPPVQTLDSLSSKDILITTTMCNNFLAKGPFINTSSGSITPKPQQRIKFWSNSGCARTCIKYSANVVGHSPTISKQLLQPELDLTNPDSHADSNISACVSEPTSLNSDPIEHYTDYRTKESNRNDVSQKKEFRDKESQTESIEMMTSVNNVGACQNVETCRKCGKGCGPLESFREPILWIGCGGSRKSISEKNARGRGLKMKKENVNIDENIACDYWVHQQCVGILCLTNKKIKSIPYFCPDHYHKQ